MRWTPMGRSRNIEDRRGMGGGRMGVGLGGTAVLLILSLIFGRDFISGAGNEPVPQQTSGDVAVNETPEEAQRVQFVSFVLDTIQATWTRELPKATGTQYHDATLVLFRNAVQSVLADRTYRDNTERVRDAMAALPGPAYGVTLLEKLVADRAPIVAGAEPS